MLAHSDGGGKGVIQFLVQMGGFSTGSRRISRILCRDDMGRLLHY